MMRSAFDGQLRELRDAMISMGAMCEEAIAKAAKSFLENDRALAATVPALAGKIDRQEREIEAMCLKLLLKQQPVAADLRTISAALKMVKDLERVGNQSADIAELTAVCSLPDAARTADLHDMALAVIRMVNASVEAFLHGDAAEAQAVIDSDDEADADFDRIKRALIQAIRTDPAAGDYAIDVLMIAKYLERIGDHAVNIGKWILFSLNGQL